MLKTPPLQTATATIDTLCGRLQSATLLEDRRAAILGLRSFAKQYPASVASGSLRELIAILRRDGLGQQSSKDEGGKKKKQEEGTGDVDTIRLVLETLLMLFNPDSGSPEAGDEIAFFMADEFSMRQDNVPLLLSLLDPTSPYADYYSRLYSLQLLSAVCAVRPERLQECILSTPLGVSRLVAMLDDTRDAVRNAGLLLLVDLTSGASEHLRKIVAFEDIYGKVFTLIRMEGGLAEAGITAQDCLSLLANLIAGSGSNQTMFRESGCVAQLTELLQQIFPSSNAEPAFVLQSREKSAFGLLQLLRFFLLPGESSTAQNQVAFFRAGTAQTLIDIGFSHTLPTPIRTASLRCAAELIANNAPLQESFAGLTVTILVENETSPSPLKHVNGNRSSASSAKSSRRVSAERPRLYIIEALLELSINQPQTDSALRSASCTLLQAYLNGHDRIKAHFLQRAISGHAQQESAANVLNALTQPDTDSTGLLFASWIVQDLIADEIDAKSALVAVKEGDESEGEDVVSFVQALGSQLENALLHSTDDTAFTAYASVLIAFVWEFAPGVDNLLAECSSLMQALANGSRAKSANAVRDGLAATLLGVIYEFSTKDSPISRRGLAPLLTQKLGRSKYLAALAELRKSPAIRDFDLHESDDEEASFPRSFIDLFTVEYTRLRKAIDKDPGVEVLPLSAAEAGVDRDVLDDLRQQLQSAKDALAQTQDAAMEASQKSEQERLATSKELQSATAEVERLRRINQAMQQGHESELENMMAQHEQQRQGLMTEHQRALDAAKQDIDYQIQNAVKERDVEHLERAQDYERKLVELGNTCRSEQNSHDNTRQQLDAITSKHDEVSARERHAHEQLAELKTRYDRLEREHEQLRNSSSQASSVLERSHKELEEHRTKTDRMTTQLNDLREELKSREDELAVERAGFAELEKELEAAKHGAATLSASDDAHGLERELKEAKEAEKSAKEELESMLLVMGDIEAKRDTYREKIKELGGEVSDDDEEDEGEEDEEDVD